MMAAGLAEEPSEEALDGRIPCQGGNEAEDGGDQLRERVEYFARKLFPT